MGCDRSCTGRKRCSTLCEAAGKSSDNWLLASIAAAGNCQRWCKDSLGPVEERPEAPVITLMLSSSSIELTWRQQGEPRETPA